MANVASRSRQTERHRRLFLRLHDAYERRFARVAVARFFREQGERLIHAMVGHGTGHALDWDGAEHRLLSVALPGRSFWPSLRPGPRLDSNVARAGKSLARAVHRKSADGDDQDIDGELPANVRAEVRRTVEETLKQRYWRKIQDDTRTVIHNAIDNAVDNQFIDEGRLSRLITSATSGEISRHRAKRIARTETTGAMNGGHAAVIDELGREGLVAGKEWVAVIDNDTRDSHKELNGKTVKPGRMFHVGESHSPAPYPGHFSLPAEERINCRCTVVAAGLDEGGDE